jgi:hypothetical protein
LVIVIGYSFDQSDRIKKCLKVENPLLYDISNKNIIPPITLIVVIVKKKITKQFQRPKLELFGPSHFP